MSLFRKRKEPTLRSALENAIGDALRGMTSVQNRGQLPDTSPAGSGLIHDAIDRALSEFAPQYAERLGVTVTRASLANPAYGMILKQLGFLVDWLLMERDPEFATTDMERIDAIEGLAPMWDEFFGRSLDALAHIDFLFRVAAIALDQSDQSPERRGTGVWFDAVAAQLRRIEELASRL